MMEHLAVCTATGLAALAAAALLGRGPARWRYALLLAALLRFALPTAWLDGAGRSIAPIWPATVRGPQAIEDLRRLLVHPGPLRVPAGDPVHEGAPSLWWWLWAGGAAACLGAWSRQLRQGPTAVRRPDPGEWEAFERARRTIGMAGPVDLRIVAAGWVPGAVGYRHPAVVLPEGLAGQLSASELDAVLAHELAHILRRDNLWAAVAHAVAAVFWFHPLVWWIERGMLREREAACDELVLERGTHPEVYLAGILKVCRLAFGGARYAGANGSNLELRMEKIMSAKIAHASGGSRVLAGALVAAAVLFPLAGGYLRAQPQSAEAPGSQSQKLYTDGVNALGKKDYKAAEDAFRRAYEADSRNTKALMGMEEVFMTQGRVDEAVSFMQKQAAAYPENQELQMSLGNILVRAGKYDAAVLQYQKLLNTTNRSADVYMRLGETYRRMKDYPKAIAALRKSAELQPDVPTAWATLALTLDAAGQADEAKQAYRRVLGMDPGNGVALNNLAYILAAHGADLDQALDYAQRARKALPDLTEALDTLGYVYLARGDAAEAFTVFREAVLKNPAERGYRSHLLLAIERKGDRSATAEALRTALRDQPSEENQQLVKKLLQ